MVDLLVESEALEMINLVLVIIIIIWHMYGSYKNTGLFLIGE